MVASARAYVSALNKLLAREPGEAGDDARLGVLRVRLVRRRL